VVSALVNVVTVVIVVVVVAIAAAVVVPGLSQKLTLLKNITVFFLFSLKPLVSVS
jgi:hypothetical protein